VPYNIESCYLSGESSAQFDAIVSNLTGAFTSAQADLDAILADPRYASALATLKSGVKGSDSVFTSTGITSVDDALADVGVLGFDSTPRDYQKTTEAKGFMLVDGNLYLCNQHDSGSVTQKAPNSVYSVSGLGKGITDVDLDYLNVIGTSNYSTTLVTQSGSYGQTAYKSNATQDTSTTGTEYQTDGNVSVLREAFRAAGGDIGHLRAIFAAGKKSGYAVVWSEVRPDERGCLRSDSGDFDFVRSNADYPLYDDQISFYPESGISLSIQETFLGINITRDSAVSVAKAAYLAQFGSEMPYDPSITCRVFRFVLPTVCNNAPMLITKGLDTSKLSPKAYSLGISISGYAIVIDITGDRGTSLMGTYTPQSIAACIQAQLGDVLSVRVFGGELVLTAKIRGASAFIQVFDTTHGAASALGIDGAISQIQSSVDLAPVALRLANVKSVAIAGGASTEANIDMAGNFLADASAFGFTSEQISALVNGDYYWSALDAYSSRSKAKYDQIATALASDESPVRSSYLTSVRSATALLTQDTIFMDIPNVDIRLFDLFLAEFGEDGLVAILSERTNIYDISINVPVSVGYSYLGQVLEKIALIGGSETTQATVDYITPFHTNAALAWKIHALVEWLDMRYASMDLADFYSELSNILSIGAGVTYSISPTTAIGDGSSTIKVGDTDLALRMQNPNWGQDILDSIAAASTLTIPQAWLNRQEETATRMLTNIENDITDWMDDKLSGLVSSLGLDDDLQMALRRYRDMISALKSVRKALKMATDWCQRQQQVYANVMKIVNAAVNFNLNMYANFEVNTKFVSCYASGTSSAALGQAFAILVNALNTAIDFINKMLTKLFKVNTAFFDAINCAIDALFSFFTANLTYSANAAGTYSVLGVPMAVTVKMNCAITVGGYEPDPELLSLLTQIKNQINALLNSLHLSNITFQKHSDTTDSLKAKVAGIGINDLIAQFEEKLNSLKSCF
jgi:hypothetical protein